MPSREAIPSSLPVSWVRRLPRSRPCQEGLGQLCKPSLVWEAQARDAEMLCSAQPRCCARCGTGAVGSQGPVCVRPAGKHCCFPQVIVSASLPRRSELRFVCSGNQRFVKTRCWANPPSAPRAQTSWGLAALPLLRIQPPRTASVSVTSRLQVLTYTQHRAAAHCGREPGLHGHVVPGRHASGASVVPCHVQSPGGDASPGGESILALSLLRSRCCALETLLRKGAPFTARFAVAPVHELIHWGNNKIRL